MHRVTQLAPNQEDPYVRRAVEQLGQMVRPLHTSAATQNQVDTQPSPCMIG
jgi:hypothetical protein